ncbi:glycan metabolism protein RagB [Parapedobacter defluvii]|uniref:Glycan metabolism protein RagB n=1 Tax=Parapedobacter defluvii TaxID=2045106 RepID=A0ABQ1KZ08_9SPHI|nr:RagB/SusD family nutrient uptake outer membrane protein [Parapedobacter defluvii]GGC15222.1 glycan metabolism protein RagB [Parapedobacter defluvii]
MKTRIFNILLLSVIFFSGCRDVLDLRPLDKLDGETLFATPEGVRVYLANLYGQLPIEDFSFGRLGFNTANQNTGGIAPATQTDDAANSEFSHLLDGGGNYQWWDPGYKLIRDINLLLETIPTVSSLSDADKATLLSEGHFLRAFTYFALVKRYGGVPLITSVQQYTPDVESLKVPRSTEKDTWDFVLAECDAAIESLPASRTEDNRRATKWVAYALKSRAALHAASLAKYWSKAPLSGPAVSQGLVGLESSLANHYYEICIEASRKIMDEGGFSLHKPTPASPEEATANYMELFQNPNGATGEVIFIKGYTNPGSSGHSYDFWFNPNQTSDGAPHPGRMNPTLDFVDLYESYSNPGHSTPIVTTTDGNVTDYNGFNANKTYLRFDTPYDIFKDKDARLWATVVLPGTEWKGKTIVIQGGYIQPDGTPKIETKDQITVNGATYYTYGAADWTNYSGFEVYLGNMTRTGFSFKKFLSPNPVPPNLTYSTTDWIEFRYAEILLNYAEAVVESNYTANGAQAAAKDAINAIRRRAGHTVAIELNLENVLRERRVELAFENKRYWDLVRRRDYHEKFNNTIRKALVPVLDLRVSPAKYIFIRKNLSRENPLTFPTNFYYVSIPGIGANGLVQNPQY